MGSGRCSHESEEGRLSSRGRQWSPTRGDLASAEGTEGTPHAAVFLRFPLPPLAEGRLDMSSQNADATHLS